MVERVRELEAAARDPGMIAGRAARAARRRRPACRPCRGVARRSTPRRPGSSACALARLSARPRSTSKLVEALLGMAQPRRASGADGARRCARPRARRARSATMWRALRPGLRRIAASGASWSMKRSGSTIGRIFRPLIEQARHAPGAAARGCAKPPIAPSSIVISTSCSRASRSIRSVSSGLAKRASATVVREPARRQLVGRLQAFLRAACRG